MKEFLEKAKDPKYHNVIQELVDFTGLPKEDVVRRVLLKENRKDQPWFNKEFTHFAPETPEQYAWFYAAAQSYVFTNARKPYWDFLDQSGLFPDVMGMNNQTRTLDFGAGIGQNCLELLKRGYLVDYFDLGHIQRVFYSYRLARRGYDATFSEILLPYDSIYRFDPLEAIYRQYDVILLPHVLEHIPDYEKTLEVLIKMLRVGGHILEHSPFRTKAYDKQPTRPNMHLPEKTRVSDIMERNKVELVMGHIRTEKRFTEPRLWRKYG